jgi:hypothetical protein
VLPYLVVHVVGDALPPVRAARSVALDSIIQDLSSAGREKGGQKRKGDESQGCGQVVDT